MVYGSDSRVMEGGYISKGLGQVPKWPRRLELVIPEKLSPLDKDSGRGAMKSSPFWGKNTLEFEVQSGPSLFGDKTTYHGRTHCKLVLSTDGTTLTETAVAVLPGGPNSVCNISGT